ncbi:MAG: glycerol-3-phosphate acyltransferase [Gammaproteobacteria bacterium RIFCSPHIGHO2_12_FULL_45_12]|nr:MAG: glycerol-3-phosphate acyltransferase [Gammaproteobacteria bacterium RIFCSPHIGHO2_12_FULL_45_12]
MGTVFAICIAYLFGSISSAILICRLMQLPDPRTQGSHNPGATNVLRLGSQKAAVLTLLGDTLKGLLPVLAAKWLGFSETTIALVALAAFLGHLFPLFFHFKGGKGVATTLGCLLALSWPAGLCWMGTWLLIALCSRYSSLASLIASALAPLYLWYATQSLAYVIAVTFMSVFLVLRHRRNIRQLLAGTESRLGK